MRTFSEDYASFETATDKEPRFVVQVSWDFADTDHTYFTSSSAAQVPISSPAVDVVHGAVLGISGQTQKINPNIATSTVGSVNIRLLDVSDLISSPTVLNQVTSRINTKLENGDGLRTKVVRVYVGYSGMPFSDYDLRLTYIVDSLSYKDGVYSLSLSDLQRSQKSKIFTPDETTLDTTVDSTTLVIPVTSIDTSLFPAVTHGAEWGDRPSQTVAYIKLDDEVIAHSGGISFDTTNGWHISAIQRGALNTVAVEHTVSDNTLDDKRKPQITEHIYLEGPTPKVMYAMLTGILLNGNSPEDTLPDHWHLAIDPAFVRLSDFQGIGLDLWDPSTDEGKPARIENPGAQEGKRYIEKEMLLWMGCFMPIYSTGEIGLRRLAGVLSDASYQEVLDNRNVASYSDLRHDMRQVINDIKIEWNWDPVAEKFTKRNVFIDSTSISTHGTADAKEFEFHTVHTGVHTDKSLEAYFDTLRDRYSGPPLLLSLNLMPSMSKLEVGDVVRVTLDQIRDMTTNTTLDRSFEVQQVNTNWTTGAISVSLFGSSQKAGEIDRSASNTTLLDTYYTQAGTELSTVLTIVAGHVTVGGTLTGHATDINNAAAIYYYDGDLTIDASVTVYITENVQLRIKGVLQINGTIDGVGAGATGGAATATFIGGGTSDTYWVTPEPTDYSALLGYNYDTGEQGYLGDTIIPAGLRATPTVVGGSGTLLGSDTVKESQWTEYAQNDKPYGPAIVSNGRVNTVPFFDLSYDEQTNRIYGYPLDIRGNSGPGGTPFTKLAWNTANSTLQGTVYILAQGGAGGAGGAGLMTVSRGMAFGVSGNINLSGGNSSAGGSVTYSTKTLYAGAGAPGAPGVLLVLLDGQVTNPDITDSKLTVNYGAVGFAGGVSKLHLDPITDGATNALYTTYQTTAGYWYKPYTLDLYPYTSSAYEGPPHGGTHDVSKLDSAHRLQYIPADETPILEIEPPPPDVTGFIAMQNGAVVVLKWNVVADVLLAGYEIRYAPQATASWATAIPLTQVTKATSITTADVPPGDWKFYIVAVKKTAVNKYSEHPASANLTVTAEQDIISQTQQAPDWSGTLSNFVLHHTGVLVPKSQNLAGADGWDTFDVFVINPYDTCEYTAPEIDITFDDTARVWGDITYLLGPGETATTPPQLQIDYKLSSGAYDGFENWSSGNLTLRYCKHKIVLDTTNGVAFITGFLPTVDQLEHTISDSGVTVASGGGSTISFPTPFHQAPFVRVFVDATSALIPVRSNITTTGFDAQVFNTSGTDVGGTVSWEAIGV